MAVVGSAHVIIRAITNQLESDIEKSLTPAVKAAGDKASKELGQSLQNGVKNVELNENSINTTRASKNASETLKNQIASALKAPTTLTELNLQADAATRKATDKLTSDIHRNLKAVGLKIPPPSDPLADWRPDVLGKNFTDRLSRGINNGQRLGLPALDTSAVDASIDSTRDKFRSLGNDVKINAPDIDISRASNSFDTLRARVEENNGRILASTRSNSERITQEWAQAGEGAGAAFIQRLGSQDISARMQRMFSVILLGTPVIGALVGGLSSLASGLFAVGAAVAPAVNALAVLPGLFGAVLGGLGATVLAFGGVGKAFSAGTQAVRGVGAATQASAAAAERAANTVADAYEDAAERIANLQETAAERVLAANESMARAQERLSDVIADNARNVQDAQDNIRKSQENLANAQKRANTAQQNVTNARKQAIQTLKDLRMEIAQGSITEGKSVIAVERARERLAEMVELPVNHRLRREAQLNYDQAVLDLEKARKKNADLAEEQANANKAGIDGSDGVKKAVEEQIDAQKAVDDAKKRSQEASQKLADTEVKNARNLRDARRQIVDIETDLSNIQKKLDKDVQKANKDLARTLRDVAVSAGSQGGGGAVGGVNAFADAMSKLSPEARRFVEYLLSVREEFSKLRDAAGEELFPKLETAIQRLIDGGFLTKLGDALRDLGGRMGDIAIDVADLSADPFFQSTFATFMESNATVLGSLGDALVNVTDLIVTVGAAVAPVTERFAAWIATITGNWAAQARGNMDGIYDAVANGESVVKRLADIFGTLWDSIMNIGRAATPAGNALLDSFQGALDKFKEFTGSIEGQDRMAQFFTNIVPNVEAVGRAVVALAEGFLKLGENPAIVGIFDTLAEKVLPTLTEVLNSVTAAVGEDMAHLFDSLLAAFGQFASSGALSAFINVLTLAADSLLAILKIPGVTTLAGLLLSIAGGLKAISLVGKVTGLSKMAGLFGSVVSSSRNFSAAMVGAGTSVSRFRSLQAGLAATFPTTAAAFRGARSAISTVGTALGTAAAATGRFVASTAASTAAAVRNTAAWTANKVALVAQTVATKAAAAAQRVFNVVMRANPIGLIITAIGLLVAAFIYAWNNIDGFKEFFIGIWDGIKKAWTAVGPFFKKLWDGVVAVFKGVVNTAKTIFLNFTGLGLIIKHWEILLPFFKTLWNNIWNVLSGVISRIRSGFEGMVAFVIALPGRIAAGIATIWNAVYNTLQAAITLARTYLNGMITFVIGLPGRVVTALSRLWNAIYSTTSAAITQAKNFLNGLITFVAGIPGRVVTALSTIWRAVYSTASSAVENAKVYLNNLVTWATGIPGRIGNAVSGMWNKVSDGATNAKNWAIDRLNELINWVGGLGGTIATKASGMWNGIRDSFKSALNWIIDKWNSLSFKLPSISAFGQTIGGTTISVPQIPRFAKGGVVQASPGGTLGLIAEAGRNERITPLDADGLSAGERMMLEALQNNSGSGNIEIKIYATPGMSTSELAKAVSRELAFKKG